MSLHVGGICRLHPPAASTGDPLPTNSALIDFASSRLGCIDQYYSHFCHMPLKQRHPSRHQLHTRCPASSFHREAMIRSCPSFEDMQTLRVQVGHYR